MRPIYHEAKTISDLPKTGNGGLWYDKFCNTWLDQCRSFGDDGKKDWIVAMAKRQVGTPALLRETHLRRQGLINAASGILMSMKTSSVFVSGLGRSHPVENGFSWHQTLGCPYLPGSSVKGVVRAWAFGELEEAKDMTQIFRIFGTRGENSNEGKHVGSVIFLDALPTETINLKAEILTPHYGPWYQNSNTPPGDWHKPIPIFFLAVKSGQSFDFGIMPANPSDEQDKADCRTVCDWLVQALEYSGVGAKTAIGFGRFDKLPESVFTEKEEIWAKATLSWDRGKQALTVTSDKGKAVKQLQEDKTLIPLELHGQLFVKSKQITAKVTVSRQGNLIRIEKVDQT
ncbi:MAG: type III-B CRISPR module RAMP protein Cmr6 [Pedobacter sp.]